MTDTAKLTTQARELALAPANVLEAFETGKVKGSDVPDIIQYVETLQVRLLDALDILANTDVKRPTLESPGLAGAELTRPDGRGVIYVSSRQPSVDLAFSSLENFLTRQEQAGFTVNGKGGNGHASGSSHSGDSGPGSGEAKTFEVFEIEVDEKKSGDPYLKLKAKQPTYPYLGKPLYDDGPVPPQFFKDYPDWKNRRKIDPVPPYMKFARLTLDEKKVDGVGPSLDNLYTTTPPRAE